MIADKLYDYSMEFVAIEANQENWSHTANG